MRRITVSLQRTCPHVPENHIVTNNNMVIVSHPPYSPDLAPCDFPFFFQIENETKGRRFETASDSQRESQAVLDSVKENDFQNWVC
jgi:hypothetical protein